MSAPTADCVLFETLMTASGHRFERVTLNAPKSLNALSLAMIGHTVSVPQAEARTAYVGELA